jgi:hypothetical protein
MTSVRKILANNLKEIGSSPSMGGGMGFIYRLRIAIQAD